MSAPDPHNVLIVTGASRGIGAAVARLGGGRGYKVCVNYAHDRDAAEAVVNAIAGAGGGAIAVKADVANEAEVTAMFDAVDNAFGTVTALVNNAAISGNFTLVADLDTATLHQIFATNVFGSFYCAREALRRMSKGGRGGAIVNLSSQAATFGGNRMAAYAASKAAINTFTVALAREAAPAGVRVNAVSPAVIDTDQHKNITVERREALLKSIPAGRMGHPQEVAEAVLWLLSAEASYVNGTILPITGGR